MGICFLRQVTCNFYPTLHLEMYNNYELIKKNKFPFLTFRWHDQDVGTRLSSSECVTLNKNATQEETFRRCQEKTARKVE